MFGLILRLLAVYVATAAILLYLSRRWVLPLRLAPAVCLALVPFLLTGKAVFTGGVLAPVDLTYNANPLRAHRDALGVGPTENPMLSDVVYQGIPWQSAVRRAIASGRVPLWNPFVLAGEPLLAVQQHSTLHPSVWISFLLPLAQGWTLAMTLRVFLALLCAYLFFRELGGGEVPALFGACAWAFSDFLVFFLGYPLNLSLAPLPLLLLGLRRLARAPGRGSAGVTLAALLLMTTAGHPETLLHAVAGAGIYFLFELAWAGRGSRRRSLVLAALCGVLALGVSAVLFLPFREAAVHASEYRMRADWYAHSQRSVSLPVSLERSIKNLVPYAFGSYRHGGEKSEFAGAAGYAGALLLPLALAGFFAPRRERWPLLIVGFLGLSAWARLPVVNDAICALPLFDLALNEYLVVWGTLAIAALAVFGIELLAAGGRHSLVAACSGLVLAAIGLLYVHARPNLLALPVAERRSLLALQVVPVVLLGVGAFAFRGALARKALPAALLTLLLLERTAEKGGFYPTAPDRAFFAALPFLDGIPRGEPYRVTALSYSFIPNIAALYGLEDVRGYEAMTFAPLTETYPLWCVAQPVWFNRVDDPTKPFLSFLNVRYVIASRGQEPPPGWRILSEEPGGRLLENPDALPRVFVPRWVSREADVARQRERLFAIRDFAAEGVVEGPSAPPAENGSAQVRITSYEAARMELDVDAREKSLIASSVTAWPGWRLTVDGLAQPLSAYNRAFLAFEVPPGHHRVVLRYWPRSFVQGLWISGFSLLSAIVFFAWPRRGSAAIGGT
jgi:hypothetical protein